MTMKDSKRDENLWVQQQAVKEGILRKSFKAKVYFNNRYEKLNSYFCTFVSRKKTEIETSVVKLARSPRAPNSRI